MNKLIVYALSALALVNTRASAESTRRPATIYIPETNDFVEDGSQEAQSDEKPVQKSTDKPAAAKKPAHKNTSAAAAPSMDEIVEAEPPLSTGKAVLEIVIAPPPAPVVQTARAVRWLLLDRVNGVRHYIDIDANKSADFNGIHIDSKTCQRRDGENAVTAVYALIYDTHNKTMPRFAGWMLPQQPNGQVFTHSQYVVRPLRCAFGAESLPPTDHLVASAAIQGETAPQTKVSAHVAMPSPLAADATTAPLSAIVDATHRSAVPPKNDSVLPASVKAAPQTTRAPRE